MLKRFALRCLLWIQVIKKYVLVSYLAWASLPLSRRFCDLSRVIWLGYVPSRLAIFLISTMMK
jgi:hypothetical protein